MGFLGAIIKRPLKSGRSHLTGLVGRFGRINLQRFHVFLKIAEPIWDPSSPGKREDFVYYFFKKNIVSQCVS